MEYTVEVTIQTRRPLTEEQLVEVAGLGGSAAGNPGGKLLETTLTVTALNVREAADLGIEAVTNLVRGTVVAVEAMTTAEADRRLAQKPRLVGISEIAGMLKISRQRASMLSKRKDFPAPLEELASGPVWRAADLTTFASTWKRKPGRPWPSKADQPQS